MEGEEERGIVAEENSQKDDAADETRRPSVKEYCPVPVWLSLIYILPSTMRR
jgi:hypothetical protein